MFNKKGSELSMNVIVLAAIAVLILIILIVLVIRNVDNTSQATSCDSMGGECMPRNACTVPGIPKPDNGCVADLGDDSAVCCVKLGSD